MKHIDYRWILTDVRERRLDVRAVVAATVVAGTVFLTVEMLGRELAHDTTALTTPFRIASLLLGEEVVRSSEAPGGIFVVALILHAMLSLTYASIVCLAVRHVPIRLGLLVGAIVGAGVYLVNHYALTPLFPAFADARGAVAFVAHVAFGVTSVAVFAWMNRSARVRPEESAAAQPSGTDLREVPYSRGQSALSGSKGFASQTESRVSRMWRSAAEILALLPLRLHVIRAETKRRATHFSVNPWTRIEKTTTK